LDAIEPHQKSIAAYTKARAQSASARDQAAIIAHTKPQPGALCGPKYYSVILSAKALAYTVTDAATLQNMLTT